MKILYIFSSKSEYDRGAWSGTIFRTIQSLKSSGHQVDYLYALRDYKETLFDKLLFTYWRKASTLFNRATRVDESFYSVNLFRQTLQKFDYSIYDIVFVPTHIAIMNALPKTIKPKIVHLADATVDSLFNYYSEFSNLIWHNYFEAHIIGKRAFRRANLLIVSSNWCRNNAIKNYGIHPDKIKVVEFGANLESKDIPVIPKQLDNKSKLNIYWSGVNWIRKGGDIALEACSELIKRGIDIELHITGLKEWEESTPPPSFVHNHGFLNKNNPNEYHELISIIKNQDIFLFPSKAECSSIALCEANGFGLPCFVYNTGGTANYVQNGYNGYMLPLSAGAKEFADCILDSIDKKKLNALSQGACNMFLERLNWSIWGQKVDKLLNHLILS